MNFNELAKNWDTEQRVKRAEVISTEIESYMGSGPLEVMEFGCGTGLISFNLRDKIANFLLLDSSEAMINEVKQKIANEQATNVETYCGEIETLNTEKKFDVIYTSMTCHHIKDIQSTLNLLTSFLKKNGKLVIVDLLPDDGTFHRLNPDFEGHHGFTVEEMTTMLKKAGLNDILGRKFYSGYKTIEEMNHPYSLFSIYGIKQ